VNRTVSTPEDRRRQAYIDSQRRIERLGLLAGTAIFLLAVVLVCAAKYGDLASDGRALAEKRIVNLNAAASTADVRLALQHVDGENERQALAQKIIALAESTERRLPRVGAIGAIPEVTLNDIREIKPRAVVRTPGEFWRSQALYVSLFLASFWLIHLIWSRVSFRGDGVILPAIQILCSLGMAMMISIRDPLRDTLSSAAFAQGVAGGCALLLAISFVNFQRSQLRHLAFVPLLGSFLLSILLFVFGSGPGNSDARVNLFGFQPVEAIKILLVLFLAGYFAQHWELIREVRQAAPARFGMAGRWLELPPMQYVGPIVIGLAVALSFFVFQKDLGPGLLISVLFLVFYGVARRRAGVVLLGFLSIAAAFWLVTALGISRTVVTRMEMWESPFRNFAKSGGDHVAHSLWAFASGGFGGTGLGLGDPQAVREIATDFILAGIGEELGFLGTIAVLALYAILLFRAWRIMQQSSGHYAFFLCLGMATVTALQIVLIAGGVLGLLPLSGVTTPFLSYGRSSLLASFCIFGVIVAVSHFGAESVAATDRFRKASNIVAAAIGLGLVAVAITAFQVQVWNGSRIAAEPALAYQADGYHRLTYNPRLLQAMAQLPRGTVYDRSGIPLASNDFAEIQKYAKQYAAMGVKVSSDVPNDETRHYPFGGVMFHLLGDASTERNWRATNTSYMERDSEAHLRGFDDSAQVEELTMPNGEKIQVERHDYSALVPLLRHGRNPDHRDVQELLNKDRDLHTTIDARLQMAVAAALKAEIEAAGKSKGAAVVMDVATGDVLASVSYPWPENEYDRETQLDRARYGLYPPASTFKLVTAMAALNEKASLRNQTFVCRKLPDGRVGNVIAGYDRPVRDDVSDEHPHGRIDLAQGMVVSCNAYYAQLGVTLGAEPLQKMAAALGINTSHPNTVAELKPLLAPASYGQGEVLATPFQMARVAATIANHGVMPQGRWVTGTPNARKEAPRRVISTENADFLARTMRTAVTQGTGRRAQRAATAIAGKTGTAEIANGVSHSWFVGFAPAGDSAKKVAFSVIIENGGYGGNAATAAAARIVDRARELKVLN
jgi:cell division protein FtsI/penicillin-binding protein 2/cell division protein FtsW (lipid II flippase)